MWFVNYIFLALALAPFTFAFFPWIPDYRCEEYKDCSALPKTNIANREVKSLKVIQKLPDASLPRDVQISRLAERLTRKYNRQTRTQAEGAPLAKRDNTYQVQTAANPSQTNSAGLDQDGTDYSYFAEVTFGDKDTPLYMLLDTGAGTSWVMGSDCTSAACTTHNSFGAKDSSTLKPAKGSLDVQYGSGSVTGSYATDSVKIAGLEFSMTFGIANSTSDQFSSFPMDGILGLSRQSGDYPNFLETLVTSKVLKDNIFGMDLNRASDGPNTGEINFGAPDTSRYSGDLTYTTVTKNDLDDWAILLDNVGVGTKQSGISGKSAYIDSGTSYIFGPPNDVITFHDLIPGSATTDNSTFTVPCSTTAPVTFTFSGVTYSVSSKDWVGPRVNGVCTSNIFGVSVVDKNSWLVGDTFLKNVYVVFDVDQNRVGFAPKKAATSTATSTTSSGSSQTSGSSAASSMAGQDGHKTPKVSGTAVSETAAASATAGATTSGTSHTKYSISIVLAVVAALALFS
ncbi:hypothetical protein ACMFMF_007074 [Clarireedia jacksonii]